MPALSFSPQQAQRFWAKVDVVADGCWLFTGSTDKQGYGRVRVSTKRCESAHRIAWTLSKGPIPDGVDILHRCDVRRCCRPAHLFRGDQATNNRDMVEKGRNRAPSGEAHGMAKLTPSQVQIIRDGYSPAAARRRDGSLGRTRTLLAQTFSVSVQQIIAIQLGSAWQKGGAS